MIEELQSALKTRDDEIVELNQELESVRAELKEIKEEREES